MGTVVPGWDVRLLDENENPVPVGEAGEICLRARHNPQYPLEIFRDPNTTRTRLGGTWFRTGDTARMDEDGYWYFLGRNDDVIKTSGYRVGPSEIEDVLNAHPAVASSGVIGIPDPVRGQAVHAYVVLKPGHQPDEAVTTALQDRVREHHSRFAYPRGITYVDTLPTSATGKVQRAVLRARAAAAAMNATEPDAVDAPRAGDATGPIPAR
jgi:acetyl-CoA synthetase